MRLEPVDEKLEFTEDQLTAIEELAANEFDYNEVAEVIAADKKERISVTMALNNNRSIAYQTYRKGFLKSQFELRQRIFLDAGHGSSPAQTLAKKILDDCEFKQRQQ